MDTDIDSDMVTDADTDVNIGVGIDIDVERHRMYVMGRCISTLKSMALLAGLGFSPRWSVTRSRPRLRSSRFWRSCLASLIGKAVVVSAVSVATL